VVAVPPRADHPFTPSETRWQAASETSDLAATAVAALRIPPAETAAEAAAQPVPKSRTAGENRAASPALSGHG